MNLKKKLCKFFTLRRRHDAGFTLVELIVVIAILAILAGVGTVGYSGYIKNANKNSDKVLVGNIIRAIETGTYSTMFESNDSFTKGATTYPVGIIILTESGCQVKASTSSITSSSSPCVMKTITNYVPTGGYEITKRIKNTQIISQFHDVYKINQITSITFCETHSNVKERDVVTNATLKEGCGDQYDLTKSKYVFEDESIGVYELKTDHVEGGMITQENITPALGAERIIDTTNSPIYEALTAAYGSLDSLFLNYSGWGDIEGDGHTYATLLTYTDTLVGDIKDLGDKLRFAVEFAEAAGVDASEYLTEEYSTTADMMNSFALHTISKYPVYDDPENNTSDWKAVWDAAADDSTMYAFGMAATRDYCYAARVSYNTAFASYCSANGISNTYVEVLKDYHHTNSYNIDIPDVTNTAAFSNNNNAENANSLYAQFVEADATNADAAFEQCKKLFEIYKDSEACKQNGETFYNTMDTVAQSGSEAFRYSEGGEDGYFEYYTNLMEEMAAYYDFIKDYNGSGIIILVSVENGLVKCEVSPSTANPRNE